MAFVSTSWRMGGTSMEWAIYHCYAGSEQCCEGLSIPTTSAPHHLPEGARRWFLQLYPDHEEANAGAILWRLTLVDGGRLTDQDRQWGTRCVDFISGLRGVVAAKVINVPNLIPHLHRRHNWVLLARSFAEYQLSISAVDHLTDQRIHQRMLTCQSPALLRLFDAVDALAERGIVRTAKDGAFSKMWLAYTHHTCRAARHRGIPVFWLERRDAEIEVIANYIRGIMGPELQSRLEDELRAPSGWFPRLGGPSWRDFHLHRGRDSDPALRRYYHNLADQIALCASGGDIETDELCECIGGSRSAP